MSNFTKNLIVGLGGPDTLGKSHYLGALCGMETIMGRTFTPVRDVVDAAFDRFVLPQLPVMWFLTVVEDTAGGVVQRGLFAGHGGSADSGGAAFRSAAELSSSCNISFVGERLQRVACWLSPEEFGSTWLANKAVYRTRMALATGAELIILAPGVSRFGEDEQTDELIRRYGYHGAGATVESVERDARLAANLGVAAHLIHGSSEGRFRIVYCTDPGSGGLGPRELEAAGYAWRSLPEELDRLGLSGEEPTGARADRSSEGYQFISKPALGLWAPTEMQPLFGDA
jgi:hypothetical protein